VRLTDSLNLEKMSRGAAGSFTALFSATTVKKSQKSLIISLLMCPSSGDTHRPSLWITHKDNGEPTTRARCGVAPANDCKCSRDQRLNVPSEARKKNYINSLTLQKNKKVFIKILYEKVAFSHSLRRQFKGSHYLIWHFPPYYKTCLISKGVTGTASVLNQD
jgi:hypothetical protein